MVQWMVAKSYAAPVKPMVETPQFLGISVGESNISPLGFSSVPEADFVGHCAALGAA